MEAIVKQDNVYVVVRSQVSGEKEKLFYKDDTVIVAYINANSAVTDRLLYGGRVRVIVGTSGYWGSSRYTNKLRLEIDGTPIYGLGSEFLNSYTFDAFDSFEVGASYLTQIENLGVDTFLTNYKNQVQALKNDVAGLLEKWEQQQAVKFDEKLVDKIKTIRVFLLKLSVFVCSLFIRLNAGLENQDYINAYDAAVSHISQYL